MNTCLLATERGQLKRMYTVKKKYALTADSRLVWGSSWLAPGRWEGDWKKHASTEIQGPGSGTNSQAPQVHDTTSAWTQAIANRSI